MNKRYYVTEQFLRTHNNKHDITLSKNPRKKIKRRSAKKAPFISPDIKLRLLNAKRVQAQRTKGDKQPTTIAQDADRALFTLADLEYFPKYLRENWVKIKGKMAYFGFLPSRGPIFCRAIFRFWIVFEKSSRKSL